MDEPKRRRSGYSALAMCWPNTREFARRGTNVLKRFGHTTWYEVAAIVYLVLGLIVTLGPVLWLAVSSLKSESALDQFPPTLLPWEPERVRIEGQDALLPLMQVQRGPLAGSELALVRRIGLIAQLADPKSPDKIVRMRLGDLKPIAHLHPTWENYSGLFAKFDFLRYLFNSVFITVVATLITLLINSMAAFALSKYRFRARDGVFALMLATLMIPPTIILVPNFLIASSLGLVNSRWAVIWPGVATPTGVFLLRQYMLTLPDELIEAARMDNASEWRIYWRIVLPLSAPALAVLAIFSVMWRWNEFLWPMIVLTRNAQFTLPLALYSFQGELTTSWNYVLSMTVITLLPVTVVFALLQRRITQGIATTGFK